MKYIIGLSYGHHESSCCLITSEGQLLYLREEWLSRVKNDYRFPTFSLKYIKEHFDDLEDNILAVCLFQKPFKNWAEIGTRKNLSLGNYLNKLRQFKKSDIFFHKDLKRVLNTKAEIFYCPHHLSHLYASECLLHNKSDKTLNIILDGYGEGLSGAIYKGRGREIKHIKSYNTNSSLGLVYSALTEWAGFSPNEDEFKVMALAAMGEPTFTEFINQNILSFDKSNLDININQKYFNFEDSGLKTINSEFEQKFSVPDKHTPIHEQTHVLNTVCSFQLTLERILINLIKALLIKYQDTDKIILSGGVFHNSKLVGEITKALPNKILVSPSPGDAGSSVGAAYFAMLCLNKEYLHNTNSPFVGPKLEQLDHHDHLFDKMDVCNTYNKIIELLENEEIFAVFSGYCEIGPRALLSRSLCCNAASANAIKKLNGLIKKREPFRPIAPAISQQYLEENFDYNVLSIQNSYWMGQLLWPKNKIEQDEMPFMHADRSVRAQVFNKKNKIYSKFIPKLLQRLMEENYIIANTSLNISGDPMVFLPEDLYLNCKRLEIKYILQNDKLFFVR
jgi:carbamoyltransferase